MKRAVTFGTFDLLHEGHRFLLRECKRSTDDLTVVVAPDAIVLKRKGRAPVQSLEKRINALKQFEGVNNVVPGDDNEGEWSVFRRGDPFQCCVIGYDQQELLRALEQYAREHCLPLEFIQADAFKPSCFASSVIRREYISKTNLQSAI